MSELKVHIELTRFVQPEKIEIDANERAVNEKSQYCFFVCTTFDSFLNDLEHWVPPTLIVGILIIMLFGSIGYGADKYEKIHGEIKNTITSNYNDVTNYHDDDRQSFVSDGIRYTFDYNKSQKTLTVFTNTSVVDATFVDGVKQKTGK